VSSSSGENKVSLTLSSDEKKVNLIPDLKNRIFPVQELPSRELEVDIPIEYIAEATANSPSPAATANSPSPAATANPPSPAATSEVNGTIIPGLIFGSCTHITESVS